MNPMNFLINYIFANSRAEHYNIVDKQPLQNMAVIGSIASMNPALGLSLIEFQAKNSQNDVPVTNSTTATTQTQAATATVNAAQVATNNVATLETIQKGIEDIKMQQNKLEEIVSNVIKNKISSTFLKPNDADLQKLIDDINVKTIPYLIEDQIKHIVKDIETFAEISKSKFIDKLKDEDKILFDKLKEIFVSKKKVVKKLEAVKTLNTSESMGSYLPLLLSMGFDRKLSDLQSKLTTIESTSAEVVPKTTFASAPIINKTPLTPKPTSTKK
jgi:hypothetical protein